MNKYMKSSARSLVMAAVTLGIATTAAFATSCKPSDNWRAGKDYQIELRNKSNGEWTSNGKALSKSYQNFGTTVFTKKLENVAFPILIDRDDVSFVCNVKFSAKQGTGDPKMKFKGAECEIVADIVNADDDAKASAERVAINEVEANFALECSRNYNPNKTKMVVKITVVDR